MMDNNFRRSPGDTFVSFLAGIGVFTLVAVGVVLGLILAPYVLGW
jgi:hypothetical protein